MHARALFAVVVLASCGSSSEHPAAESVSGAAVAPPFVSSGDAGTSTSPSTTTSPSPSTSTTEIGPTAIVAQVTAVQRTITANAAAYTQVDLEELSNGLTLLAIAAQSPGGLGAASAQCVSRVVANGFAASDAVALCPEALVDPAGCALLAQQAFGFDRGAAIELCKNGGSAETATCASTVFGAQAFTRPEAVGVCSDRDGTEAAACTAAAIGRQGLDRASALSLCAHRGTTDTSDCVGLARSGGFAVADAVTLCAVRGTTDTAQCAIDAFASFGFNRAQALALCKPRGQPGNATCADRVHRTAGLSLDQAVTACQPPPSETPP